MFMYFLQITNDNGLLMAVHELVKGRVLIY